MANLVRQCLGDLFRTSLEVWLLRVLIPDWVLFSGNSHGGICIALYTRPVMNG